ncbi:hypothetical protein ALI144C_52050 [Actinosynnema sp. ALI-1.44]|uniref:hypothetical protein n=1 Tax=Actinosynnema sp. ALI-1.44 TaxID=1933779 RepID=UPI00097C5613|nr:hypothetical protein [Actinosynnema sp. ALI-1.44]ONI71353.1 hypothetical protein ALI144C_52050 [Actinosynnema sp. ALI-1.44]
MNAAPAFELLRIAKKCVDLVDAQFQRQLDWSVDSLDTLDEVCAELSAVEPLEGERFDLWWQLVGAYTGQVIVETYGGQWITHEQAPGAFAVAVNGITGFPFSVANRVLSREPFKSLASLARSLPAISGRQAE